MLRMVSKLMVEIFSYIFHIRIRSNNLWFGVNQVIDDVVFPSDVLTALEWLERVHVVIS